MAMVVEAIKILNGLSDKDLELIKQLCLPGKIVCQNTGISPYNLRQRIKRLMTRMGVENRTALAIKAIRLGLVTADQMQFREYDE